MRAGATGICERRLAALVAWLAVGCSGASGAPSDAGVDQGTAQGDGSTSSDAAQDAADGAASSGDGQSGDDAGHGDGSSGGDATNGDGGSWWQPGTGELPWQWEIDHEINTSSATDMGTGDKTYANGSAADPVVYDIDGFDNTAADVASLHAKGKKVICYIEVGAAESYRPDYSQFKAADLGTVVGGYPNEKYLDIRDAAVLTVIEARVAMCAQKGFDGIEPDIDDSYTDTTGFPITEADDVAYLAKLSGYAHGLGVAWGLKNGGDGGDPTKFVPDMVPYIDFAVVEEPFYLMTIGYFSPALYNAGKAVFVAEYTNDTPNASSFCPQAIADHTNAALFDVALNASVRTPCQ
jgi:hypothetical protein